MNKENAKDYLPLVQALADGKVIQYQYKRADLSSDWMDLESDVSFDQPAERYRIKPEPREIWANRYPDGYESLADYASKDEAIAKDHTKGRATQVRYREVLE